MNTVKLEDYASKVENAWCPGCGNFGILKAVKQALVELDLPPEKVLFVSGIGQAPKLPHYLRANTFNGLHGREVTSASAAKTAASDLTVIVHGGEGGIYGEGGNHLLHAIRRNPDMTVIVHDNRTYGLTKGQPSPTTAPGTKAPLAPEGVIMAPLNPLALAISQNCSFVGQGMSAENEHLVQLLREAIRHRGLSLVNVLQPCVTWDKVHTYQYYKKNCYKLDESHDPADRWAALKLAMQESERIPLGVFYKTHKPVFHEQAMGQNAQTLRDRLVEPSRAERLFARFQ